MSEQESIEQPIPQSGGFLPPTSDRDLQKYRTQNIEEFKQLKLALTGRVMVKGESQVLFPKAMLCEKHFGQLAPYLLTPGTKSYVLSRVEQVDADFLTIELTNSVEEWFLEEVDHCDDCNLPTNSVKQMFLMGLEAYNRGHTNRAVEGHEAQLLSTMQTVQENVITNRAEQERGSSWLSLGGLFRRKR